MVEPVLGKPKQVYSVTYVQRRKRNHVTIAGSETVFDPRIGRPICVPGYCRPYVRNVR